ncbi:Syntaxin-binding protein 5-like [Eumeta japonica]|uniref:Syntaxin-binding protein 5-like n=1 Tax=Eumeta variegata TaxID=151549 RepID=A0A4C1ZBI1_EUMVA|nr:Syntaxin-binding protein 5-like [Eumeta japonica]
MSSLENISQEAIQCLAFADSYTKKSEPTALSPTLWVGTSLGSVFAVPLTVPDPELRHTHPAAISTPARDRRERTPTKQSSSGSGSRMSPTPTGAGPGSGASAPIDGDRQFVVVASEKQARVVALPSHNCVYRQQIVEADFVVKAEIVSLKDSEQTEGYRRPDALDLGPAAHSKRGHGPVSVAARPVSMLRVQSPLDPPRQPLGPDANGRRGRLFHASTVCVCRIARTFCFSNRGHGLYLASPTEIQKFTIDTEFCYQLNEMLGELFLPREMPEPPKESFFRGLFGGGGARPLDREELFGEGSGRPNRTVAKHIPGPTANLESLGQRASTAAGEVSRAHQLVVERGDKLSQLEDRTERMHLQAAEFGSSAHQLMLKYKDKKWYQL